MKNSEAMSDQEQMLTCPICKEGDFDEIGMAFHFRDCERAMEVRDAYRAEEATKRKERLKGFKL